MRINTPCGYAHTPGKVCRHCEQLKKVHRESSSDVQDAPVSGEVTSKRKTANHRPQPEGDEHRLEFAGLVPGSTSEVGTSHAEESAATDALKMDQARNDASGNAARCKRYRERHGDEYRKRNRERMRKKRDG